MREQSQVAEIPSGKLIVWRDGIPYMSRVSQSIVQTWRLPEIAFVPYLAQRDFSAYEVEGRHGQSRVRLRDNSAGTTLLWQFSVWRELMFVVAETDDELVDGIWVPMILGKPTRHA